MCSAPLCLSFLLSYVCMKLCTSAICWPMHAVYHAVRLCAISLSLSTPSFFYTVLELRYYNYYYCYYCVLSLFIVFIFPRKMGFCGRKRARSLTCSHHYLPSCKWSKMRPLYTCCWIVMLCFVLLCFALLLILLACWCGCCRWCWCCRYHCYYFILHSSHHLYMYVFDLREFILFFIFFFLLFLQS